MNNLLSPFANWCCRTGINVGTLNSQFADSKDIYQAMCWIVNYLEHEVIPKVNEDVEGYNNLYAKYVEIKNFVEHYFDNLDVQEEINNKLDKMAEDGTLQEIIEAFIKGDVKYIFPKFVSGAYSQDYSLIIHDYMDNKKSIMVDSGSVSQWASVLSMLTEAGVYHLDYFFLTHYHGDHDGNIANLINSHIIDSNTVVYLPAQVTNYPSGYESEMATINNLFLVNNINTVVPEENSTIEIGTLNIKVGNTDSTKVEAYNPKDGNEVSMVLLLEHLGTKTYLGGDAGIQTQERLYKEGFLNSNVDLYKINHHGIDQQCYDRFVTQANPTFAVQTSGIEDFVKNNYGISEEAKILKDNKTKIYNTCLNKDYITFISKNGNVICSNGSPLGLSGASLSLDIYVDKNASKTSIQDGTSEHPYSDLTQAIGSIQDYEVGEVTIHLANGYYGNVHEAETAKKYINVFSGKNVNIRIEGTDKTSTWLSAIVVRNSNLYLKNLSVDTDLSNAIYAYGSYVKTENVDIKSHTDTTSTTNSGIILRDSSDLIVESSTLISECNQAIIASNGSTITSKSNALTLGNTNGAYINKDNTCLMLVNGVNFVNSQDSSKFTDYYQQDKTPKRLLAAETALGHSFELNDTIANYDWIEICFKDNSNAVHSTGRLFNYKQNTIKTTLSASVVRSNGTTVDTRVSECNITDNTVTLSKELQITSEAATIWTGANVDHFKLRYVIGGYVNHR